MLQREAARLRQEQETIDSMSKKLEHVHFSSTIQLNVGGHRFTTSLQTLTKDPNSMLAAMFSGKFEMKPSEDGTFFIDRDGTHFRFVLNYLRTGKLTKKGATFLDELAEEAAFYQIQGILDDLVPKAPQNFEESVILTTEDHRSAPSDWLPQQDGKWQLLMRASQEGFQAKTFHSKCDDKGPTVTIVKSGNNIFGGFTETSWSSNTSVSISKKKIQPHNFLGGNVKRVMLPSETGALTQLGYLIAQCHVVTACVVSCTGSYVHCSQSFLFSMMNPQGVAPSKISLVKDQQSAIFCDRRYGPLFGGGCDLHISNNANTSGSSYSNLGFSYQLPT
ncbi:unnamed protein product [Pocillopora meandrina]|uniref:TLDc domain-containing protein n=1 Tax=Pocillopora meandrina TaxID=46732 RepID=A0AAU9WXA0_9CNID|nr:unnamed protein product [Pocillopora meandrina]